MNASELTSPIPANSRVGFLGPLGTFTEQALLSQPDLAASEIVPIDTIDEVLRQVDRGEVDYGFVAIENAIEGTVNLTLDTLAFDLDLRIQREVLLDIHMNLMAAPGTTIDDIATILSIPVAVAQVRDFLREKLPEAELKAANSTAEAAQILGTERPVGVAAVAPALAAELYGLDIVAADIEDHHDNQTRFVLVSKDGLAAPTGHDKTSLVIYQRADVPGSLLSILQEFAARSINLTKLESRPTKTNLGDYCFIVDLEGHVVDEVVADCLRNLKMKQGGVKFLGSYPAAAHDGAEVRAAASADWQAAKGWVEAIRRGEVPPT